MVEASQDQIAQMVWREARQETRRPRVSRGRRRRVNHHLTILFCFHLTAKQDEKEMKISFHLLLTFLQQELLLLPFFRFLICDIHYFDFTYQFTFLLCNNYQFCLISYPFFYTHTSRVSSPLFGHW